VPGGIHTVTPTVYLGGVTCGWEAGTCRSAALVAAGSGGYYPAVAIIKGTTATVTKLPGTPRPALRSAHKLGSAWSSVW
jgi:hypothetical protein